MSYGYWSYRSKPLLEHIYQKWYRSLGICTRYNFDPILIKFGRNALEVSFELCANVLSKLVHPGSRRYKKLEVDSSRYLKNSSAKKWAENLGAFNCRNFDPFGTKIGRLVHVTVFQKLRNFEPIWTASIGDNDSNQSWGESTGTSEFANASTPQFRSNRAQIRYRRVFSHV